MKAAKDEVWSRVTAKGEVKQPEKKFTREGNRRQPGGSSEEAERNQDEQGKQNTMRSNIVDQLNELKDICQVNNCLL